MQNKRFTRTLSYRGVDVDLDVDRRAGRQAEAVSDGVHLEESLDIQDEVGKTALFRGADG